MPGDDHLRGPVGLQPAHRSESVFELAVIGLDRIVRVSLDVMPRRRDQLVEHGRVDRGGVGDHLARCHLQHRQGPLEEPVGAIGVAARGDEHVDDLPALVDGPVDIPPDTVDLDIRLIHEPPITRRTTSEPRRVRQQRCEPLYPPVDRDVIDLDTPLDQQVLYVAVPEVVAQVPPDRDHDHLRREPESGKR